MLEIKKEVKKVKIEDTVYDLRKPSLKEVREFRDNASKEDSDADVELIKMLSNCGIPKEVLDELDVDSIDAISSLVMPKKKK